MSSNQKKNVRDQAGRQSFSWLQISKGIYKLGNRALGNIKDNPFPGTCLKDTETSFQGPELTRPLHKSQGLTLNQFERGFMVSQNVSTGRACSPARGFIEMEKAARELKRQLAHDPDSEPPVQCFSPTLNSHPLTHFFHQQREASLNPFPLGKWQPLSHCGNPFSLNLVKNKFENI